MGSAASYEAGQAVQDAQQSANDVLSKAQTAAANTAAGIACATQQAAAMPQLTGAVGGQALPAAGNASADQLGDLLGAALQLPNGRKLLQQAQVI